MNAVTVREYARLTYSEVLPPSLDKAQIPKPAFDWLVERSAELRSAGAALVHHEGRQWLRLDNYVGVIETPGGTQIEILPKHIEDSTSPDRARRLLIRMIEVALDIPPKTFGPASISAFDAPISEWVISEFLASVKHLIKRGVRLDYTRVEREEKFLRGRLLAFRQMRRPPERAYLFDVEYDLFSAEGPENRLIRSSLDRVLRHTRSAVNWRLARELSMFLQEVPPSENVSHDLKRWRTDRLMIDYASIRPWCYLILNEQTPLTVSGAWHGLSFLFPMERLFEAFVANSLNRQIENDCTLIRSASTKYLCDHQGARWFLLQPDLTVVCGERKWILDAKWKRINSALGSTKDKYGLSQTDFYQLFAYGERYLDGKGELFLIYPLTATFRTPLPPFWFSDSLALWVVPFDLESRTLNAASTTLPLRRNLAAGLAA